MSVQTLIDQLDKLIDENPNLMIEGVSREFCSYRGYYEHLAVAESVGRRMAAVAFLNLLHGQIGQMHYGYKGGEFIIEGNSELFVAEYGRTGKWVTGVSVEADGIARLVTAEEDWNGF